MTVEFKTHLGARDLVEILRLYGSSRALGRILALVEDAGCKTVAIETRPSEQEYAAEYSSFFSKVLGTKLKEYPTRLHFFKDNIASLKQAAQADTGQYLGYCDLRPTEVPSISTAVIDESVFVKTNKGIPLPDLFEAISRYHQRL